jgi:hypothetical protein
MAGCSGLTVNSKQALAATVQLAWSSFRLDVIRGAVVETIAQLDALSPRDVLGHDASTLEGECLREAYHVCCSELREEAGMPPPAKLGASTLEHSVEWPSSYLAAIEAYRRAAGVAMQAALDQKPTGAARALNPATE